MGDLPYKARGDLTPGSECPVCQHNTVPFYLRSPSSCASGGTREGFIPDWGRVSLLTKLQKDAGDTLKVSGQEMP